MVPQAWCGADHIPCGFRGSPESQPCHLGSHMAGSLGVCSHQAWPSSPFPWAQDRLEALPATPRGTVCGRPWGLGDCFRSHRRLTPSSKPHPLPLCMWFCESSPRSCWLAVSQVVPSCKAPAPGCPGALSPLPQGCLGLGVVEAWGAWPTHSSPPSGALLGPSGCPVFCHCLPASHMLRLLSCGQEGPPFP